MTKFKKPLKFALCLLPIAIVAGFFSCLYLFDSMTEETLAESIASVGSKEMVVVVMMLQTVVYAVVCGFFGYILADKLGLWRPVKLEKKKLITTLCITVPAAMVMSLDPWTFGNVFDGVKASDAAGQTFQGIIGAALYGGIVEELMMRLFLMSLIAFVLWKVFFRQHEKERIPAKVFIIANVAAALLFSAGHLPATVGMFGGLSPLLLLRCFLFNGGAALIFGWLYRRYGIVYAMLSHMLFHVVTKLIWCIFL